jgi:hypothetical protein
MAPDTISAARHPRRLAVPVLQVRLPPATAALIRHRVCRRQDCRC